MANNERNTVTLENAKIFWLNFRGAEGQYNRAGDRNFHVEVPDEVAKVMEKDGWNIKWREPREEGDPQIAHIAVKVNFNSFRPPKIVLISSSGRTNIGPGEAEIVDYADIKKVDVILSPFQYEVNGKSGISCYLQTMFLTINEDELELKYAQVAEAPMDAQPGFNEPTF